MSRDDLLELENLLMEQIVKLRHEGDYDSHAANIRGAYEALYRLTQHLREQAPRIAAKGK